MKQTVLPGTRLRLSRLAFGTARLHHLATRSRRQALLAAAFDCGFTHFDTAPSYGFGLAEEEIGRFLQGRRQRVTVATKFGLYPPGGSKATVPQVWFRKALGKILPSCSKPFVDWSSRAASESLDRSLRRLQTERVDVLWLHEPIEGAIDVDACLSWLEFERAKGRVGTWGLAGPPAQMGMLVTDVRLAPILQVQDSQDGMEADAVTRLGRDLQITYGYLSANRRDGQDVGSLLQWALKRNHGSVLVSSRSSDRLAQLAGAAEEGA